jgi:diguanylate cyclase (GGDEF)-like protein/PAS domain S-box-containing protein
MLHRDLASELSPVPRVDFLGVLLDISPYLALATVAMLGLVVLHLLRTRRRLERTIAEADRAKSALAESEKQFRTLAEMAAATIFVSRDTRFLMVNPAMAAITGYSRDEILAMTQMDMVHPEHRVAVMNRSLARQRGETVPARYEVRLLTKSGETRWVDMSVGSITFQGQPASIGTAFDITERKRDQERIRFMAQHDTLTGLPNRALFADRLEQALRLARRASTRLALLFLDLDDFKPVNDTFGHAEGDLLLQEAARRLRLRLRDSDTVGRIGGDEFVILLAEVRAGEDAAQVAEVIRQEIERPFDLPGGRHLVSCSVGIAVFPEHGENAMALTKHADMAMYRSKSLGRNRVEVYREGPPEDGGM